MKVLLTGSMGFIGNWMGEKLVDEGHEVTGVDKARDARSFFREDQTRFDLVVHMAAVVGGRVAVESRMMHAENLEIDAGLFQWAEHTRPGRIVYVSSVAAYPVQYQCCAGASLLREIDIDWTDDSVLLPDELYGWAKLTGEFLATRSSVPVSVPRLFTVYGDGQDSKFPFANLLEQVKARRDPVTVWGSGNQTRDFIHVEDVVDGIYEMALLGVNGPVNFCTGKAVSLTELARRMAAFAGYAPEIKTLPCRPEGLAWRVGDPSLLHEFYEPKVSLDEGIRRGLK